MKKMLLTIGEPISNIANLASVATTSVSNNRAVLTDKKTKTLNENEQDQISMSLLEKNSSFFEKVQNDLLDDKISSTKLSKNITDEEIKELITNFAKEMYSIGKISETEFNHISNSLNEKIFANLRKEIKKFSLQQKKAFKKDLEITKAFNEKNKRVFTDRLRNYKVNIIDNEENSKRIAVEFFELKDLLKEANYVKDEILSQIIRLNNLLSVLTKLSIANTCVSIICTFASLWFPFITFVSIASSAVSLGLSAKITNVKSEIKQYDYALNVFKKTFGNINPNAEGSDWETVFSFLFPTAYGLNHLRRAQTVNVLTMPTASFIMKKDPWWKILSLKNISFSTLFGLAIDGGSLTISIKDQIRINEAADRINSYNENLTNKILSITKRLSELEEYEWVVINETEQTDEYWNGGTGGRNLVFKNLQTGEEKTIDEMLALPDWLLRSWNLVKVYNPLLNVSYIRKLPNDKKVDNLG